MLVKNFTRTRRIGRAAADCNPHLVFFEHSCASLALLRCRRKNSAFQRSQSRSHKSTRCRRWSTALAAVNDAPIFSAPRSSEPATPRSVPNRNRLRSAPSSRHVPRGRCVRSRPKGTLDLEKTAPGTHNPPLARTRNLTKTCLRRRCRSQEGATLHRPAMTLGAAPT